MDTTEENKDSKEEEKGEISPEIENTSSVKEEEQKTFKLVEFKIDEEETWICEKHKAPKIFYCIEHSSPFCPNCLKDHKDCFSKDQVLEVDSIGEMLKKRCQTFKDLVTKYRDSFSVLKKDCVGLYTSMMSTKTKHEELYKFMQEKMESLAQKKMKSTQQFDQEVLNSGSSLIEDINKVIVEYEEWIKNYNEIQENALSKENTLQDLILSYNGCKASSAEVLDSKQDSIIEKMNDLKTNVERSESQSNIESAEKHIESVFRKIHNEAVSIVSQQTGQGYLFNLSPLSSTIFLFDIENKVMYRKELKIDGKPFRVPYGSGAVFYQNKIILTGGMSDLATQTSDTYEYSLLSYSLVKRNSMICPRSEHAVVVHGGRLYCVGGRGEKDYLSSCERCIVDTQNFSTAQISTFVKEGKLQQHLYKYESIPELNEAKSFLSLCIFNEREASYLYALGGMTESQCSNSVERLTLSPILQPWEKVGTTEHFCAHSMGSIQFPAPEGSGLLLFGGILDSGKKSKDVYFYDPSEKDSIKKLVDWTLPMEDDFVFKPVLPSIRSNTIYIVCHFQVFCIDYAAKKPEWAHVDIQRYPH